MPLFLVSNGQHSGGFAWLTTRAPGHAPRSAGLWPVPLDDPNKLQQLLDAACEQAELELVSFGVEELGQLAERGIEKGKTIAQTWVEIRGGGRAQVRVWLHGGAVQTCFVAAEVEEEEE